MPGFARYVVKCLWGHRTRSVLTLSGVAVAIFVFCFVRSVQQSLQQLTRNQDARRTLIVFQKNRFCPTSSQIPQDYADRIGRIPGVLEVMPVQVWTNNCRASLDAIVFHGVRPDQLRTNRDLSLVSGSWQAFAGRRDAALVGRNVARRRHLAPGQAFTIGGITVQVVGVFTSPVPTEENLIYTGLEFLQYTRGRESAGLVTQHEVRIAAGADPVRIAAAIDQELRSGPVATATRPKGAFQASTLSDLVDLVAFAHWLGLACVSLVLGLVATTMVMSVQDRIREHALLQTIGVRPARVFRIVVAEGLLLSLFGGAIGTLAAMGVLAWGGLSVGAEGVAVTFRPSWSLVGGALAASSLVGLAASAIPALQAARTAIVPVLRQG